MGTSGNPAKKAVQKAQRVTSVSAWKGGAQLLQLPSGNVVKARNPGLMSLAHQGLVPNALMSIIMESLKKGREPKPEEILSDNIELNDMLDMMDKAVMACVVEPQILPPPVWTDDDVREEKCSLDQVGQTASSKRDPDALYIDEDVSDDDKQFIFQWVTGGTTNLEQFREERANLLATIPGQPVVGGPAK